MKRSLIITVFAGCMLADPVQAGSLVWGATEWTQLLNYAQLVQQTVDQYEQLQRIKAQLEEMYRQGEALTDADWGNARNNLLELADVVRDGEALAYSMDGIEEEYHQRFKDYDEYTQSALHINSNTFRQKLQQWSRENDDTIRSSLRAANLQNEQFVDEALTMQTLEAHSQSAVGRMQAIQAGNEIAAQQVGQIQKLRQLMMSQMQMQANFMASQREREEMQDAVRAEFYRDKGATVLGDEKDYSHW
jgi:type IV secretion system protein TrbJ